jgi:hypothetical protein
MRRVLAYVYCCYAREVVAESIDIDQHQITTWAQYWPKVAHGPAHFLRARSARHLQYMNDDTRATNASEVRISRVCHMLPEQHPAYIFHPTPD